MKSLEIFVTHYFLIRYLSSWIEGGEGGQVIKDPGLVAKLNPNSTQTKLCMIAEFCSAWASFSL